MLFEKGSTQKARQLNEKWLSDKLSSIISSISLGLPEYDDRFERWRVPLHLQNGNHLLIGEVYLNEQINEIIDSTDVKLIKKELKNIKIFYLIKNLQTIICFIQQQFPIKSS